MKEHNFTTDFLGKTVPCFYIKTTENAEQALARLMEYDCIMGLDTETAALPEFKDENEAALHPQKAVIRLLQIYNGKSSVIFDLMYLNPTLFTKLLETKRFVGHNSLFDLQFLINDCHVSHVDIGCTYILWKAITHATRPTDAGVNAGLADLTDNLLGSKLLKVLQRSDWSVPELTFEQIQYAALDAVAVYYLAEKLAPSLEKLGITKYYQLCKKAQWPIAHMQLNGMRLDVAAHRALVDSWRYQLGLAKKELVAATGLTKITDHTIADYLSVHLSNDLLSIWPRTDEGKLQTDAHTLAYLGGEYAMLKLFAVYQKLETLCTTFGSSLIAKVNPVTSRVHCQYKICGCRTGRLSASKPNLQNLPRDKDVRKNFTADFGNTLVVADYSQIEIRVGAELSQDKAMLNAYRHGVDLHALTASVIGKVPLKNVTKADRQKAKAFNFGLMFGLGPTKFSKYAKQSYGVDVSSEEASESIKVWRNLYSGYRAWQLKQVELAQESLYSRTVTGKLRRLDPENCYGTAMNTPVQGSAAEIVLNSLIRLQTKLERYTTARICNTVHDEIIVECTNLPHLVSIVTTLMEESMTEGFLDVFPNGITDGLSNIGVGANWGEAK